jgi:hypothetical protein
MFCSDFSLFFFILFCVLHRTRRTHSPLQRSIHAFLLDFLVGKSSTLPHELRLGLFCPENIQIPIQPEIDKPEFLRLVMAVLPRADGTGDLLCVVFPLTLAPAGGISARVLPTLPPRTPLCSCPPPPRGDHGLPPQGTHTSSSHTHS